MSGPAFAGHLGVRAPDRPLLRHLAGSDDPLRQVELLAASGLAGVFDNYLLLRTPAEQARIGGAAAAAGLRFGSFVHAPLRWNRPDWVDGAALDTLDATLAAAGRSGARDVIVVTGRVDGMDEAAQRRAMAANLARAADRLAGNGMTLCVEATHPVFAPGLLIERLEDAIGVAARAGHPQVRVALDLGHVALHGEDPVAAIGLAAGRIGAVQIADVPGRVEPGAGTLDWPAILAALAAAGWDGLIELELEPAGPGADGERALLARLAALGLRQKEKPISIP